MVNKLKYAAQHYSERTAYMYCGNGISYAELWQRANSYASLLQKQGNGSVIIYGHKSIDMIISMLACIIARRTYIPIDTYMPKSRLIEIISTTDASLVIENEAIDVDGIECCGLEELWKYKDHPEYCCESDIIYTIFTSGSTGNPKGVPISNGNLINFTDWISALEPFCGYEGIRVANQASFSFDLSVADIYYSLCNGHTLVAMPGDVQKDFSLIYSFFLDNRIEMTVTTPTFIKLCLLIKEFNAQDLPHIKAMYFCGEQLEASVVKKLRMRFPNCKIVNAYGPTEATSAVSASLITDNDISTDKLLPVGDIEYSATDISIENDEIILKGKSVFGGYIGGIGGGHYMKDGVNCYRTGDIGYINDGKLYCKGRMDSQIKYMGYRIELYDIENNIKALNGVNDAAVIAKYSSDDIVKQICAFVVCDEALNAELIKQKLTAKLPRYMIPARIIILNALPLNENKKTDRRSLALL